MIVVNSKSGFIIFIVACIIFIFYCWNPCIWRKTSESYTTGMTEIIEGLYLGNIHDSENLDALKKANIKYILNVTSDIPDYFLTDFEYYKISIKDIPTYDPVFLKQMYIDSSLYIDDKLPKGNVFVHCFAGVSRSASVIIAYLILKKGFLYPQAYEFVRKKRNIINPNPGFRSVLSTL